MELQQSLTILNKSICRCISASKVNLFKCRIGQRLCHVEKLFEPDKETIYSTTEKPHPSLRSGIYTYDPTKRNKFTGQRQGEYYEEHQFQQQKKDRDFQIILSSVNWKKANLPPIKKNLYEEPEVVKQQSKELLDNFWEENRFTIGGNNIPKPILDFSHYKFPKVIDAAFKENKFSAPMPIQSQTWPAALSGRDIVGIGETGSGKTIGFVLPSLVHAMHQHEFKPPPILVLAPTRELVQQLYTVYEHASKYLNYNIVSIYGGTSKYLQVEAMNNNPMVCIATPGRLLDLISNGSISVEGVSYVVLDEADRMLDMGFEKQLRSTLSQIRPDRQTLMWSATWPAEVEVLAEDFLNDPIHIKIGCLGNYANPKIKQEFVFCETLWKKDILLQAAIELKNKKILVFVHSKRKARELCIILQRQGISCSDLHGDHSQFNRDRVVNGFRRGVINVVIATDLAARGLDVKDINLVVNYDFPNDIETYIHRIGRTGRAGKSGNSLTLFTRENVRHAKALVRILKDSKQTVPEPLIKLAYGSST